MPYIDVSLAVIERNSLTRVEHEGRKFVVVRSEGKIYAYLDACPHAFWPLSSGTVRHGVLECPGHGWEFDVRTGRCINAPDRCLTSLTLTAVDGALRIHWDETNELASRACEAAVSNPSSSS